MLTKQQVRSHAEFGEAQDSAIFLLLRAGEFQEKGRERRLCDFFRRFLLLRLTLGAHSCFWLSGKRVVHVHRGNSL